MRNLIGDRLGLGYAILAGLPPVTGLYVSFFPVIIYAFLGSSRHLSLGKYHRSSAEPRRSTSSSGTFAVSSLIILASLNSRVGTLIPPNSITSSSTLGTTMSTLTNGMLTGSADYTQQYTTDWSTGITSTLSSSPAPASGNRYLSNDPAEARIIVASALALVAGLVHLAMAILHFGYVTVYLSDSIVQGFTTGCAIHIITSQIPTLLGIKIPTVTGQSKVIKVGEDQSSDSFFLSPRVGLRSSKTSNIPMGPRALSPGSVLLCSPLSVIRSMSDSEEGYRCLCPLN